MKPRGPGARAEVPLARPPTDRPMFGETLREEIGERSNLRAALPQGRGNTGSPGVDAMTVEELPSCRKTHGSAITAQVLNGAYHPKPVKRGEIPKPGSQEQRTLGSPGCGSPV